MTITEDSAKELAAYLSRHEYEIATAEGDFDDLYDLFCEVLGTPPKSGVNGY